jgi:F-type H+-transporting ATPase subunit b
MLVSLSIPVSVSVSTLLVELVIFLVMVWVMEKLVFSPIRAAWAERNRRIEEGLAASTEGRDEIQRARAEVHTILNEARQTAQQEVDAAVARAGRIRDGLVAQATEEFQRLLEGAQNEIAQQREQTAASLQDRVVDMALLAAARVTGESYNQPQVRELAAAVVNREGLR